MSIEFMGFSPERLDALKRQLVLEGVILENGS